MTFPPDYPFEVHDEIARGGMGSVMAATDARLGREVALKVALPRMAKNPSATRRFLQEARILARLDHPNIVPVHDLGATEEGLPFYTMKRVRGRNLEEIVGAIRDGDEQTIRDYPLSALLTVFQKICDAVGFAHSRGIVHRDLKPENVMIGEFGEVLVLDWGLAKVLADGHLEVLADGHLEELADGHLDDGGSRGSEAQSSEGIEGQGLDSEIESALTMDGQIMGTPQFMAPEQAEGRIEEQDERTDVFALGGVLYSLLTLRAPAVGTTVGEILDDVRAGYIPPPIYYNRIRNGDGDDEGALDSRAVSLDHCPGSAIPEALSRVTMKAMAFEPDQRYASVGELQAEIAAWQSGQVTAAEEAGPVRRLGALLNRHRAVAGAFVVVLALALALFAWLWVTESRARAAFDELKESAPVFRDLALTLRSDGKLDEALVQLEAGIRLQPDNAAFQLTKGHLLQSALRLGEAKGAYDRALGMDGSLQLAATNAALCDAVLSRAPTGGELPAELIDELRYAAAMQDRPMDALQLANRIGKSTPAYEKRWKDAFAATGIKGRFFLADSEFHLHGEGNFVIPSYDVLKGFPISDLRLHSKSADLSALAGMPLTYFSGAGVVDLSPLRGAPIETLGLGHSELADLSPVSGMPLKDLHISNTHVSDLNPLKGAPLESIILGATRVFDLEPLRGMKLKHLQMEQTRIRDLEPLRGMPLVFLNAHRTLVEDLAPLSGMPLTQLHLERTRVVDLSPLRGMPLTQLELAGSPVESIDAVGSLKNLTMLGLGQTKVSDVEPLRGLELERLVLNDTFVADVAPLRGQPIKGLFLRGCPVSDLSPLAGMPLDNVELMDTLIEDLSALKGASLKTLNLSRTRVSDLTPLVESPLETLRLVECRGVADVRPLTALPLTLLNLFETGVRDLAPLMECASLETLILPPGATPRSVQKLRDHPGIKRLSFENETNPVTPVEEFWKAYDAGQRK